jgi:hypothetical protein
MKIVNLPNVKVTDPESLMKFYVELGADLTKKIKAIKVRMNIIDLNKLHEGMIAYFNMNNLSLLDLIDKTPGVDDSLPQGKVKLINGWNK